MDEGYQDSTTNIFYSSDANFIDSGENRNISRYCNLIFLKGNSRTSEVFQKESRIVTPYNQSKAKTTTT